MDDIFAPLRGLKVIEIGIAMAGPFCGLMLADYGADVIKVERIGSGDESRNWAPFFKGRTSHYFAAANRNKRSLEIDLKSDEGRQIIRKLARESDVVIDNFRVGALDRAGLGYDELSKINPRLIYCGISGFGRQGPRAGDRANDIFMQAFAGNMSVTGEEGRGPVKAGISVADIGGGMFGTIGILLALAARERTGKGQRVDTSLMEGQLAMLSYHLTYYFASGTPPVRRGAAMQLSPAYRAFEAADDWIVVGAFTDRMWEGVCRATGRTEWINDPRFKTGTDRAKHRLFLIDELNAIFRTKMVAEWVDILNAQDVPSTPVQSIDQVVIDEQVLSRDMVVSVDHPVSGEIRMAGLPVKLSDTPGAIRFAAPLLGQHSTEILSELGFHRDQITDLMERGVVGASRA
ncbi:CoA transferase [Aquamicrobium sp. LC103]|uniref:CaiB/BaiF CoA transferase family protein n=1 Tax=Aquamicrobium sp. LC103 TaxID=1120658 RepID=UPI00063E8304|nr:CoA transferase [Aquamicrobium sp. LC103]